MKARVVREGEVGTAADWRSSIMADLQEVEEKLSQSIGSRVDTVTAVSRHLLSAGGKRLRPALVLLSAQAAGGAVDQSRALNTSAVVELIHMATLVHDDVIDNADSRRGRVTANISWGNRMSVLSGDCMLAKAFRFLAIDGDQRILHTLSDTTLRMSEGEVLQAECERNVEKWREHYLQIIGDKTARFLSACCRCGAIIADASPEIEEALAQCGMEIGLAFQLTDDILDIAGDSDITGKPVGSDLRDGKVTLPVLLALDSMTESERTFATTFIERDDLTPSELEGLCMAIRVSEGIEKARDRARTYIEQATARLELLPPSPAKDDLSKLAAEIIDRIY